MIWHIMRKDWKLFWPLVVGVALIEWIVRITNSSWGIFRERLAPLPMMLVYLGPLSLLAVGVLIVLVVQADPIPGLRQDWLVRPIRRKDLLLSKLLFVALLVQGPIFIAEVIQGIAAGFPLSQAIGAPLSRSLYMFIMFDLPVLAFAGLTRNLLEAVGAGFAVAVGVAICINADLSLNLENLLGMTGGVSWVTDTAQTAWGMIAVAGLLSLLYFRRKTNPARWIFGAATAVWLCAALLPWQTAFAVQERFSPQLPAADPVRISFEPNAGDIRLERGDFREPGIYRGQVEHAFVPVNVQGLGDGELLGADRTSARLVKPDGRTFELGQAPQFHDFRGGTFHQSVSVPEETWNLVKDQPMRLEIDYSLTMLKALADHTIPARGANQWVPEAGRCATRMNSDDTQIEFGCLVPGRTSCVITFIQNAHTGTITAQDRDCRPDYAPYFGRLEGDSLSRTYANFLVQGVNTSELKDSQVVVRVYRPLAHFTRHVVIPDIRLADWAAK
jgi:hypothetical protein